MEASGEMVVVVVGGCGVGGWSVGGCGVGGCRVGGCGCDVGGRGCDVGGCGCVVGGCGCAVGGCAVGAGVVGGCGVRGCSGVAGQYGGHDLLRREVLRDTNEDGLCLPVAPSGGGVLSLGLRDVVRLGGVVRLGEVGAPNEGVVGALAPVAVAGPSSVRGGAAQQGQSG